MSARKGFGKMFAPVEKDFQEAVSKSILALQQNYGKTFTAIGQRIGVDRDTITNARDQDHSLKGWAAFRLIYEFNEEAPEAIAPLVALLCLSATERDDGKMAAALRSIKGIVEPFGSGDEE
jgi:hypothetical protein